MRIIPRSSGCRRKTSRCSREKRWRSSLRQIRKNQRQSFSKEHCLETARTRSSMGCILTPRTRPFPKRSSRRAFLTNRALLLIPSTTICSSRSPVRRRTSWAFTTFVRDFASCWTGATSSASLCFPTAGSRLQENSPSALTSPSRW